MTETENGKDTGTETACNGGPGSDDKKTIDELTEKVAFLQKKLQIVGSITRHDVLNQLTAIVGYNELLGMMVDDPKFRSFLEKEKFALNKITAPVPVCQGLPEHRRRSPPLAEYPEPHQPRERGL